MERSTGPPDLKVVLPGKSEFLRQAYTHFWSIPGAKADVEAYRYDEIHEYKVMVNGNGNGGKLETNFTHPERKSGKVAPYLPGALHVFAESSHNMLIGLRASYHTGLFPARAHTASCSYVHVMAIPKTNIYNIVSLRTDEIAIVDDMEILFKTWWAKSGPKDYDAKQNILLEQDLEKYSGEDKSAIENQVYSDTLVMQATAAKLTASDFVFVFHPDPTASVPHLHMHIIAAPAAVRVHSTAMHDQKSVLWSEAKLELRNLASTKLGLVANSRSGSAEYTNAISEQTPFGASMKVATKAPYMRDPGPIVAENILE